MILFGNIALTMLCRPALFPRNPNSATGRCFALFLIVLVCLVRSGFSQAGFNDDRVMLQGFYWESCRYGHPERYPEFGTKNWYVLVREKADAIRDGRFSLIWLPPPCDAGDNSAGYGPKAYFNLNNSYGSFDDQRALLGALLQDGVEPVADLVLNHRNGQTGWTDFKNPDWGLWAICADDECFSSDASGVKDTPLDQRGAEEESPSYRQGKDYQYNVFRDIDHTNKTVRRDILRYMLQLKSLGYRGWRYDMVHGFGARWIALYNRVTRPTFSVGEYDWDKHSQQRGWMWDTATEKDAQGADRLLSASSVFDFTMQGTLKSNKGRYAAWYGYGNGMGMMGDTTDGLPWKNRAVTFLENHDTGYRTNDDGSPEKDHQFDSFANTWEVEQAYAYILTHPGVPCVYWKHYFDWGNDLHEKIKALINARKVAGVNSGSTLHIQSNARSKGIYAAMLEGSSGQLYVRIGGNDDDWQPSFSNYSSYRDYAHGAGWKVWLALPGNPDVQQAQWPMSLPLPAYRDPKDIQIVDSDLN